jgi:CRP-like cAMP-binding protein
MTAEPPLGLLVARLEAYSALDEADRAAIIGLPHVLRSVSAHEYVIYEGDQAESSCLVRSGFLARHKLVADGTRQIVSIHMAGDMVNMQNSLLKHADHNVEALTEADIALIPAKAILEVATARPAIAMAMWLDTLIDGSVFREWIANVGRRDARTKTAHILCEFGVRQEKAGLGKKDQYDLPLTQEQLADALGLTQIHVNRTLKALEASGLISRDRRRVTISDWNALRTVGDFDPSYLHMELMAENETADAIGAHS